MQWDLCISDSGTHYPPPINRILTNSPRRGYSAPSGGDNLMDGTRLDTAREAGFKRGTALAADTAKHWH
jgi:hypothetical protein